MKFAQKLKMAWFVFRNYDKLRAVVPFEHIEYDYKTDRMVRSKRSRFSSAVAVFRGRMTSYVRHYLENEMRIASMVLHKAKELNDKLIEIPLGSGFKVSETPEETLERIRKAREYFDSLHVDTSTDAKGKFDLLLRGENIEIVVTDLVDK